MVAAFRSSLQFSLLTGASFLDHPGGEGVPVPYRIEIVDRDHPATKDVPDFDIASEQYYMHLDPRCARPRPVDLHRRTLAVGRGGENAGIIRADGGAAAASSTPAPDTCPPSSRSRRLSAWSARGWRGPRAPAESEPV